MPGTLIYTEFVDTNDPGSTVALNGVNDSGDVVGSIVDASGEHSFVAGPGFQDIFDVEAVGASSDVADQINNSGEIIGLYRDADFNSIAYSVSLNDLSGATAIPGVPTNAYANGIDANGDIVGVLPSGEQFQVVGGVVTDVPAPYSVAFNAISEDGNVALIVVQESSVFQGPPFNPSFENLLATRTGVGGGPIGNLPSSFEASDVNNAGQVIGGDGFGSFFRDTDGTVYGIDIAGAYETVAQGINDNGEIVGSYVAEGSLTLHAFTTTVANVIAADDVLAAACYCVGTLIATENGNVPVEDLKIGDRLQTASGTLRPIKWIGRRSYGGRFIAGNKDILPVCIKAGALADNVPRRDLWISPHLAMFIDGLLIEARDLVNGTSIVQTERVETLSYFHIELETHDVIVAEGALSETYLDEENRGMFQNASEFDALYAGAPAAPTQYCAPRVDAGYQLEAVRRQIARRSGLSAPAEPRIGVFRRA